MAPAQLRSVSDGYYRRVNYEAWLHGLYCHIAFSTALDAMLSKKGTRPRPYPAKPYSMDGKESKKEEDKEAQEEKERLQAKLYMQNMIWAGGNWGTKK